MSKQHICGWRLVQERIERNCEVADSEKIQTYPGTEDLVGRWMQLFDG